MVYDCTKWVEATKVVFPKGTPLATPVFLNTYTGVGVRTPYNGLIFPWGVWTTVDLSDVIPVDAKAVLLQGILIITHGNANETADLTINLRPPSSPELAANYEGQVIEAAVANGQRCPFSSWVAVENCKFQFWWNVQQLGTWPDYSSYGVNLALMAFAQ